MHTYERHCPCLTSGVKISTAHLRRDTLSSYYFALASSDRLRTAGVVAAHCLECAMGVVGRRATLASGDRLIIGALGFPPATFDCVAVTLLAPGGGFTWVPTAERLENSMVDSRAVLEEAA